VKVHRTSISPGYFRLLKIPILEGRDFTEGDEMKTEPVMIVDQAFAKRFYGGASPVGRQVQVWKKWFTVVGLVRDSKYFSFTEVSQPHFYLPFRQSYQQGQQIVFFVRTKGDPDAAISTMRREAAAIDPNASSFTAAPLAEYNALLLFPLKLAASLLAALGVIAFLLASVGLYGVMSYAVSQRTHEIGIRMALGARPGQVLGTVVRQGMVLTAGGVGIGLVLALASMGLLASFLVGVSAFDPLTFAASSLFLGAVAAVASFLPARHATRIDPFAALRSE
jgi:putative ABC transport system permease protein